MAKEKTDETPAPAKESKAKKLTHSQRVDALASAMSVVNDLCDSYEWPKPDKDAPDRVGISGISNAERLMAATNLVGKDTP